LIVDNGPCSRDSGGFAVFPILAELSFSLEFVHELNSVDILSLELPFMLIIDDLEFVRKLMGANFLCLEKVDGIAALTHVEVPHTEHLSSQAMNWLICLNNKCFVIEVSE